MSEAGLVAGEGTVYPLLSRLRREDLVVTTWRDSQAGPARRYYSLSPTGARALAEFRAAWSVFFRDRRIDPSTKGQPVMNAVDHPLAAAYRERLRAAGSVLPPREAAALQADITSHLGEALRASAGGGAASDDEIRAVLDRLGEPADLVAQARREASGGDSPAAGEAARPRPGRTEIAGVVLLVAATILAVVAPVGLVAW